VQNFNKKLQKIMKYKDNVRILNYKPTREDFTQHGLNLNATGKAKVAKLMSQNISPLSENRKKHPTRYYPKMDHHPPYVNNIPEVLNEEYVVMGNERENDDQIDSTIQGIETTSLANGIPKVMKEEQVHIKNKERNEDQMNCENQGIRASTRPKRSPNTRSDDFLWT
jgi:hypothetical protein